MVGKGLETCETSSNYIPEQTQRKQINAKLVWRRDSAIYTKYITNQNYKKRLII